MSPKTVRDWLSRARDALPEKALPPFGVINIDSVGVPSISPFRLAQHVPDDHLLRKIDRFIDLSELRVHLGLYYSDVGRPSIDPKLTMRVLIIGYGFGIRHGRFRESDLFRKLFETIVARCIKERTVGGEAFAVDASMIVADANRRRGVAKVEDLDPTSSRSVAEYLAVLDDAAFGGATPVEPKLWRKESIRSTSIACR